MIINFVESLIASFFFTNYFDLKINKYVYFIINFILISVEINIDNIFNSYSITLPLLVASTVAVTAYFTVKNKIWEIIFISYLDQLIVGISIIVSLMLQNIVSNDTRVIIGKVLYFLFISFYRPRIFIKWFSPKRRGRTNNKKRLVFSIKAIKCVLST